MAALAQQWIVTPAGVRMPGIIYGTAWKKIRTADLVLSALLAGFRGIDTACQPKHYDEALVGVGLKRATEQGIKRGDVYLQTKFTPLSGQDPARVPYAKSVPVEIQVAESFATSQRNLQTAYVDGLILHSPFASQSQTMKAWRAMEAIQHGGGARQLGISNCYDLGVLQALYAEAELKPAIVQNRFYEETRYDSALRTWCAERGIVYQSFWSLTANPHIVNSDTVRALAHKHGKTHEQIFFRYLSQSGIVPLTGTTSAQHMRDDLHIFEFALSPGELEEVSSLLLA
jgi:diketogulonate reductase-like aldo/keto reductase